MMDLFLKYRAGVTLWIGLSLFSAQLCSQDKEQLIPLFDKTTKLEPDTKEETEHALITRIGDRVRDRHARESQFKAYDHYLSFYWEQRTIGLEFVDKIAKGGNEIVVNIYSLTPLNEPNFRSFYRGQNTVAEYHSNTIATLVGPNHYQVKLNLHPVEKRELRIGDKIEFEFSPFLKTPEHGRSNYYGTTMLYVVGQGTVPWKGTGKRLDSVALPMKALLGGGTTLSYQYSGEPAERFKQMAGNMSPQNAQPFVLGRRLHHTNFKDGSHSENPNPVFTEQQGKLGPRFVSESCIACHVNNGRALPPGTNEPMFQSVVKVAANAAGKPHAKYGSAIQPQSINGESDVTPKISRYEYINGEFGDGEKFELRKPVYVFDDRPLRYYSVRLTPQLVGMGLLEAIDEREVLSLADPKDENGDGISGKPQRVKDPETGAIRLGRFGYKAGQARIRHQIGNAFNSDMGVTTSVYPGVDGKLSKGAVELQDDDLNQLERYIQLLGVAAQRDYEDEGVIRGRKLFEKANCSACHTPSFKTSSYHPLAELRNQRIQPFSDLLLHDMGDGLADSLGEHDASGSEWRTAPLWGIGLTQGVSGGQAYLHDGRARSLEEAILWHGGEGEKSKEYFRLLSKQDRTALVKFLNSL